MQLKELIAPLKPLSLSGDTEVEITGIQFDSRLVQPGNLFVATPGTVVDGHDYINRALEAGAAAIVCEHPVNLPIEHCIIVPSSTKALGLLASHWYANPSQQLTLVGVTGTNGKTTIATLLYHLTRAFGHKTGLLSTVCNYINDIPVPSTHTTPDALELNRLLRQMVDAGCQYAFMEVSSHAIAQNRIEGLDFDGAIFTNLTRDHIDFHKTFDNYRDTKKLLFDNLKTDAFAITNKDDRNGLVMTQNTKAHIKTYSTQSVADYTAQIVEEGFDGMSLLINRQEVFVPLVGRFNVSNILAIYATALSLGFPSNEVLRIISTLRPVNGRFETIHSPKGWTAIVDYAHTPDALENVINTINEIRTPSAQLITVVGCGGNRDKGKRPMMAHIARQGSGKLILTSDNPRDEQPADIIHDMLEGLSPDEQRSTLVIEDRRTAIQTACALANKNDVILVAGKGHEDYQIINGVKHHFDDHEVIRQYL